MTIRRPPRRLAVLLAASALALLGAGCGGSDDSGSDSLPAGHVDAKDNVFEPKTVSISAGDTVTWTFRGAVAHNVSGEGFTSKTVKSGTFEHTFEKPGSFDYVCTIHAGMTGTVEVK